MVLIRSILHVPKCVGLTQEIPGCAQQEALLSCQSDGGEWKNWNYLEQMQHSTAQQYSLSMSQQKVTE